ncbi:unnamed protein product [Candidatus Protochlamydia amoebophila UWE25]|uniref:Uncharacterized protein n=1 Tax=Protochlamydia amoebophila (strain UWE25) TaxID=264201 RepID=A0A2P9HAD8_PARUW|nr:unnamed protein product [Candidatus Protochlamydia amoebophila UWE25]
MNLQLVINLVLLLYLRSKPDGPVYLGSTTLKRIKEVAKKLECLDHQKEQSLIDRNISELLAKVITTYRKDPRNYRVYHGHLADLAGVVTNTPPSCITDEDGSLSCQFVKGINLSGWNTADFLPLRISYLFWLTMSLVNEDISKRKLPKFSYPSINTPRTELTQRLVKEICVELRTLRVANEVTQVEKNYESVIADAIKNEKENPDGLYHLLQDIKNDFNPHAELMLNAIQNLKHEEEVSYSSGSIDHCVYVSFRRMQDNVLIRVDNAGLWSDSTAYHPFININGVNYVYPSCIALLPLQAIEKNPKPLKNYLLNILIASLLPEDKAKDKIYNVDLIVTYSERKAVLYEATQHLLKLSKVFTPSVQQTVGNCVVASHNIGMEIRINQNSKNPEQEPYTWVKRQETRTSATADPQIGII